MSAGERVREVGGQHRFAHMQGLKQTVQLAWNVQILNSEGRSGMELEAGVGDGVWLGLYRLWRQRKGEENRAWGSGDQKERRRTGAQASLKEAPHGTPLPHQQHHRKHQDYYQLILIINYYQ